jgi:putative peptidoglycan lipid II flippase
MPDDRKEDDREEKENEELIEEDRSSLTDSEENEATKEPRLLFSAGTIGLVTLLSRITGLLRVQCQAYFLGTGAFADVFRVAFLIPNLFRRFVGEGAMSIGFVPVLTSYIRKGDRQGLLDLIEKFYTLWTLVLLGLTLAGILLAGAVLASCPFDSDAWTPENIDLTVLLTRWMFIYLFLVSFSAVGQSALNAFGVFALPAATPLLFNVAFVGAAYGLQFVFPEADARDAVWFFVVGTLIGGVLQCLILVPSLLKRGVRFWPRRPAGHPGLRESLTLLVKGTFSAGIYQINTLVSVLIAMSIVIPGEKPHGAIASLEFSTRLMEFVLGIFVFGLSTVGLTAIARQVVAEDHSGVRETTSKVLRFTLFLTLPSTVGLELLGEPVIDLIYNYGAFDDNGHSVALTLQALRFHALGLVFIGASRALTTVFYAYKEVGIVIWVAGVNLIVNVGLCLWLANTPLLHGGIALASSIAAVVQAVALMVILQRRKKILVLTELALSTLRAIVASGVMAAVCLWLLRYVEAAEGRWALGAWTGVTMAIGAGVYFLVSWLLGSQEMKLIIRRRRRE